MPFTVIYAISCTAPACFSTFYRCALVPLQLKIPIFCVLVLFRLPPFWTLHGLHHPNIWGLEACSPGANFSDVLTYDLEAILGGVEW